MAKEKAFMSHLKYDCAILWNLRGKVGELRSVASESLFLFAGNVARSGPEARRSDESLTELVLRESVGPFIRPYVHYVALASANEPWGGGVR
jgi:hypothetical protein